LVDEKHKAVSIVSLKILDKIVPVYNLEIEDNHTYFAHGILVHNVDCQAHVENKTYKIVDGKKVLDDKGKELSPVEIYNIFSKNPQDKDAQTLVYTIDRNELFELLDYFSDWSKDPVGFEKLS
jgi:hypothetical protein